MNTGPGSPIIFLEGQHSPVLVPSQNRPMAFSPNYGSATWEGNRATRVSVYNPVEVTMGRIRKVAVRARTAHAGGMIIFASV